MAKKKKKAAPKKKFKPSFSPKPKRAARRPGILMADVASPDPVTASPSPSP